MLKNGIDYFNGVLVLREFYNDTTNEFVKVPETTIRLKHSLLSLARWEAKYERPFLDARHQPNVEETLDYIRFMTITQNVDPIIYLVLTNEQIEQVNAYISASMTGTTFGKDPEGTVHKGSRNPMSAEVIYYYMCEFNIPLECEKWHLNRLLTLIRVCGIKKSPPKKSKGSAKSRQQLNAARRKRTGSKG